MMLRLVVNNPALLPPRPTHEPTIVHALKMWDGNWSQPVPPVNLIEDPAVLDEYRGINRRLSIAFRRIARLRTAAQRMEWLEAEVLRTDDYALAPDPYRATLMRWWLDIFAATHPHRDAAYSRTGRASPSH